MLEGLVIAGVAVFVGLVIGYFVAMSMEKDDMYYQSLADYLDKDKHE